MGDQVSYKITLPPELVEECRQRNYAGEGYRELVRRWLEAFGPGTEEDIVWWLGATKSVVRAALAELDAEAVSLDHDGVGWVLPGDAGETPDPGPWAALLPVLDPTVMGGIRVQVGDDVVDGTVLRRLDEARRHVTGS